MNFEETQTSQSTAAYDKVREKRKENLCDCNLVKAENISVLVTYFCVIIPRHSALEQ
jgi:hypothetical protein